MTSPENKKQQKKNEIKFLKTWDKKPYTTYEGQWGAGRKKKKLW